MMTVLTAFKTLFLKSFVNYLTKLLPNDGINYLRGDRFLAFGKKLSFLSPASFALLKLSFTLVTLIL